MLISDLISKTQPYTEVDVCEIAKETPFACAGEIFTVISGSTLQARNVRRSSRGPAASALAWLQNSTVVQSLDPDTIFGSMNRYLKGLDTPCVHDDFVPWVRDAFASNPDDFLFLVVEHPNKNEEIVCYLWADCEQHLYPHAMYIRHVIATFEHNRLGSLLLRVQEFKISEMARAAGVPHWTAYLNFAPGKLSTLYAKAGYVDACLPSDVAMLDAKLDDVHTEGLVKQISTPFDNFFVTIGARELHGAPSMTRSQSVALQLDVDKQDPHTLDELLLQTRLLRIESALFHIYVTVLQSDAVTTVPELELYIVHACTALVAVARVARGRPKLHRDPTACVCVCLLLQDLLQSCSRGGEEESGRHVL